MRQRIAAALLALMALAGCGSTETQQQTETQTQSRGSLAPPQLEQPKVVQIDASHTDLKLDDGRDYELRLPDQLLQSPRGLRVDGGHNVVLIGGALNVTGKDVALTLLNQTGTVHVEGVRFGGPRLTEGIDLGQPKRATVQLQNIVVGTIHGSYETNHADLIQTWAGPKRLYVDGFAGSSDYQGFFLNPNELYKGPQPELFSFRNVYIDDPRGGYVLWRDPQQRFPLRAENVFVRPNLAKGGRDQWIWPKPSTGDRTWESARVGQLDRATIRRIEAAGTGYRSR
jgi:hypothetical protein